MNNVFEEIIKQLNEESFLMPPRNKGHYADNGLFLEDAVEIVQKVAKEYAVNNMDNVIKNILDRLEEQIKQYSHLRELKDRDCLRYGYQIKTLEEIKEIVQEAAKEYTSDISDSNKNWIPCSQDNMPRMGQDVFATILSSKGEYYTDTLRYYGHHCGEDKWRLRRDDSLIPASKVVAWQPLFLPEPYIPVDKQNDFEEESEYMLADKQIEDLEEDMELD